MILRRFDPLSCSLKRVHANIFMLAFIILMNKTKDQISWVSSHDLYWENKMWKRKRFIVRIVHAQTYPRKSSRLRPLHHRRFCNNYGLWCNRLKGVLNNSCVVVVSCCATDWSVDYVSIVIQWINKDCLQTRNVKVDVTNLFRVPTYNKWLKWFRPSFN